MITAKIVRKGRGYVFIPSDFLTVGPRASVDQALSSLAKKGVFAVSPTAFMMTLKRAILCSSRLWAA